MSARLRRLLLTDLGDVLHDLNTTLHDWAAEQDQVAVNQAAVSSVLVAAWEF